MSRRGESPGGQPGAEPAPAHVPVMCTRVVALLSPALRAPGCVVVDATVGMGGHAEALLSATGTRLVGLDRDPEALRRSAVRLSGFGDRVTLVHAVYDELPNVLSSLGLERVQGILFDLGVSSLQLDEAGRGFAYAQDAVLDMRMDQTTGISAAEVVNSYHPKELARIIRRYGEERFATRVAAAIVRARAEAPITSTAALADLVRSSIPAATRRVGGHPAKRTFQALRIEVNQELDILERAIPAAIAALAVQGRIVVMSYQSLEDKLVKGFLTAGATSTTPLDLPVPLPGHEPLLRLLTKGAEIPSADELGVNPRSASVRVRAAERVRDAA